CCALLLAAPCCSLRPAARCALLLAQPDNRPAQVVILSRCGSRGARASDATAAPRIGGTRMHCPAASSVIRQNRTVLHQNPTVLHKRLDAPRTPLAREPSAGLKTQPRPAQPFNRFSPAAASPPGQRAASQDDGNRPPVTDRRGTCHPGGPLWYSGPLRQAWRAARQGRTARGGAALAAQQRGPLPGPGGRRARPRSGRREATMAQNLIRIDVERRQPVAGGKSFGETGPYEWVAGKVYFSIDPNEPGLPYICDLDLAPRNRDGLVEFSATFDVVRPVDLSRGTRRVLYEFSNRGNRAAITAFNYGKGRDFTNPETTGDGFLMRQGYTVVWSGWQGDLIDRGTNCVAYLPEALQNGQRLRGWVRQEFSPVTEGVLSMGTSAGAEGGENVQPYPVINRATATLTMREKEADPRIPVPPDQWELAKAELKDGQVVLTPSVNDLYIKGGFKPGWLYEFIYETEARRVMGLGFLGVRDF